MNVRLKDTRTKDWIMKSMAVVSAFLSSYSVSYMLKGQASGVYGFSNSIFSLFCFLTIIYLNLKAVKCQNKKLWGISIILALLYSIFMILGRQSLEEEGTAKLSLYYMILIVFGIGVFAPGIVLIYQWIDNLCLAYNRPKQEGEARHNSKVVFLFFWGIIFLAWMPLFLASYPGVFGYDSVYQLGYYQSGDIYLHHPLIHTYLLGFFVDTIGNYYGSYEIGMCLYSLFQMMIMSACFAYTCNYLRKEKMPKVMWIGVLLWSALYPVNAIMAFSSTKDVLYTGSFLVLLIQIHKLIAHPKLIKDFKFTSAFIAISFINIIFRSQAIYIWIAASMVGLIVMKKYRIRRGVTMIVTAALLVIYNGPLTYSLGGVKSDSLREMMSVPIMQLSRAAVYEPDKLAQPEIEEIEEYIPNYAYYPSNQQAISDALKNSFNSQLFKEDPGRFVKLWMKVGRKCWNSYVFGWTRLSIGLWYPDMNYRDPMAYHPYWEYDSTPQKDPDWVFIERKSNVKFKWLTDFLWELTYNNSYQKLPVVSMLFSSGFVFWLLLLNLGYLIYENRFDYLYLASFPFFLWGTLLLGPVVLYRYIYPLQVSLPILWILIFAHKNERFEAMEAVS